MLMVLIKMYNFMPREYGTIFVTSLCVDGSVACRVGSHQQCRKGEKGGGRSPHYVVFFLEGALPSLFFTNENEVYVIFTVVN